MYLFLSGQVGSHSILSMVSLLLIFILVLVLAYFSAKLVGKLQNNTLNSKSNIKIIESCRVGNNKFIGIVKIGGDYYALAFGKDEINLIDKLDESNLNLSANDFDNKVSFKEIFSKIKDKETDNIQDNTDKK